MKGVAKDVLLSKVITFNHKKADSTNRTQVGLRSHIVIIAIELDRNMAQIFCNFRACFRWEIALNGNIRSVRTDQSFLAEDSSEIFYQCLHFFVWNCRKLGPWI